MHAAVVLFALIAAPPEGNELTLLKTFRDEFIAIAPGTGPYPTEAVLGEGTGAVKATFAKPFAIAKYEVPQNLWEAVMGANPSKWKGPRNSVEMLSYAEAADFCKRITERLREARLIEPTQTVRLPTEAEWEYAARAGTTTVFSFGDDVKLLDEYGWHTGNAAGNDPPVGAKKPNPWGLYDVHGYLWEWCTAPEVAGPAGVVRGGSWKDPAEALRSASRRAVDPAVRDDAIGLRCVLE